MIDSVVIFSIFWYATHAKRHFKGQIKGVIIITAIGRLSGNSIDASIIDGVGFATVPERYGSKSSKLQLYIHPCTELNLEQFKVFSCTLYSLSTKVSFAIFELRQLTIYFQVEIPSNGKTYC